MNHFFILIASLILISLHAMQLPESVKGEIGELVGIIIHDQRRLFAHNYSEEAQKIPGLVEHANRLIKMQSSIKEGNGQEQLDAFSTHWGLPRFALEAYGIIDVESEHAMQLPESVKDEINNFMAVVIHARGCLAAYRYSEEVQKIPGLAEQANRLIAMQSYLQEGHGQEDLDAFSVRWGLQRFALEAYGVLGVAQKELGHTFEKLVEAVRDQQEFPTLSAALQEKKLLAADWQAMLAEVKEANEQEKQARLGAFQNKWRLWGYDATIRPKKYSSSSSSSENEESDSSSNSSDDEARHIPYPPLQALLLPPHN